MMLQLIPILSICLLALQPRDAALCLSVTRASDLISLVCLHKPKSVSVGVCLLPAASRIIFYYLRPSKRSALTAGEPVERP